MKTLGKDFLESLQKFELYKPGTRTVVDHEELRTALQIVPRTVMALLIKELTPMNIGENKDIFLPVEEECMMNVQKHERDVYSGEIRKGSKIIVEFKNRAIPGIGLVIMSAFELYDVNQLADNMNNSSEELDSKIQRLVDERLELHDLIGKVVDKKILQREAVSKLVLRKLTDAVEESKKIKQLSEITQVQQESTATAKEPYFDGMTNGMKLAESIMTGKEPEFIEVSKGSEKLKKFIELRKTKKPEFSIQMSKGETVDCPDCGKNIFDGSVFSGCICLGDDREKKVFIKKTEEGIKVRFGKGWDIDNIEMLLSTLRKKRD
jgi:hypothetical protein